MAINSQSRALILADVGEDVGTVADVLGAHGYQIIAPTTLGSTWRVAFESALAEAELVVCIVTPSSVRVLFEIGIAWARGSQLLVIAAPGTALPLGLDAVPVIRCPITQVDAIDYALKNIRPREQQRSAVRTADQKAASPRKLARLRGMDAAELERFVAELFLEAGIEASSRIRLGPREIDLAVWSDELRPYVGAPLIVEIKKNIRSEGDLMRVVAQFTAVVLSVSASWGLLIYELGPPDQIVRRHIQQSSRLMAISVDELVTQLQTKSLVAAIRDLRNNKVHGARL